MQAAGRTLRRWTTVGAVSALLAGLAGAAQAHDRGWHRGWWNHGRYWGPSYVTVAPAYRPYYYYAPYYRPYYVAPPVAYAPPVVSYPEPTYAPYAYAAPGMSFNFTVPLR
jgi:hypothetical protein